MNTLPRYSLKDVQVFEKRGPWATKSGGDLSVLFAMSKRERDAFFDDDNSEFQRLEESGHDIRGLRSYEVSDIGDGQVGGKEWHAARTEYVRAVGGSALWICVDRAGNTAEYTLDAETAVIIPPQIFHVYKALEDTTRLQVVCNTLYDPELPATHDTFFADTFNQAAVGLVADL